MKHEELMPNINWFGSGLLGLIMFNLILNQTHIDQFIAWTWARGHH